MTYDVFISYAHEEVKTARRLADALVAARGWSVWWDTSLRTGEQYPRKIQEAVAASRSVVVLWSKDATTSDWVVAEASEGWNRKILVPVLLDGSEPPLPFRQTQARNLSQWRGGLHDPALLGLIEDIQRAHALGPQASAAELAEREARRRTYQRKLWVRRTAYAGVALLAVAGGWFGWRSYQAHAQVNATAERLAQQSDAVRAEALKLNAEEEKVIWWSNLFEHTERLDRLELSTLLGVEAMRHRKTEHTERALRDSYALLPWSDQHLTLDDDDLPIALRFNGDGRLLAAGGGEPGTLVWDLEHDKVVARIAHGGSGGLDHWVDKRGTFVDGRGSRGVIDFNPARDEVATAGPDKTARIWEARTGRELHRLDHDELVTAVSFDARGRWLASSDESGNICVWEVQSGRRQRCMAHGAAVYWIGFSPSAALLASVGVDGAINVWRTESGTAQRRLVHGVGVQAARFAPGEKEVATFGSDVEDTRLWNLDDGSLEWKVPVSSSGDAGVLFLPATRTMVIGEVNGKLSWWDLAERAMQFSIPTETAYLSAMAFGAPPRYLVTIGVYNEARAWDASDGRLLKRMPYYRNLMGIALSPDGERFASMGEDQIGEPVIEITRIWPPDPVAAACEKLSRNLTRNEWRQHLAGEPYRLTCPSIPGKSDEEPDEQ